METKYNDMVKKYNGKNQELKYLQDSCNRFRNGIDKLMKDWPSSEETSVMVAPREPAGPPTPSPSITQVSLSLKI